MPENLTNDSSQDSPFNPGELIEATRSILKDEKLRAGGTRVPEHAEEGMEVSEEAKLQLESEYRDVVKVLEFFNAMGFTNQELDDPLRKSFFEEYVRKVSAFAVVTARARDKGLLDHSLSDLTDEQRQAVYAELSKDYREINAVAASEPFALSKDKLSKNPLLYHSAEIFAKLAREYPEIPEGTRNSIALSSPMSPEKAAARAVEISKDIAARYPAIPRGYRFYLAINHPKNYEDVAKHAIPKTNELAKKYPDVPRSYLFNFVLRNTNPEKALVQAKEIAIQVGQQYPEIPEGYWMRIATASSDNWKGFTQELVNTMHKLAEQYPQIPESYYVRLAFDFANPSAAAKNLLKLVEQLKLDYPSLTTNAITTIAYKNARNAQAKAEAAAYGDTEV